MADLPDFLSRGERARLFPVLADTSKEGRTLSILLACLENVEEFGRAMLLDIGQRVGQRARIEAFTEVVLRENAGESVQRPDGLLLVRSGSKQWSALVEAKIGNAELYPEQVEAYLDLAKLNGIDAIITISNQFTSLPAQHPVPLSSSAKRKADLFHWSWMYVWTEATLLLNNDAIADRTQRVILSEMVRFLLHPSAGVKSFDQMPSAWTNVVNLVQAGGAVSATADLAREVVGAWHQEVRDLSLVLSRQLGVDVQIKIPRAQAEDPTVRQKADLVRLAEEKTMTTALLVPGAAAPIDVCADLQRRSVMVSMRLRAPEDRQSTKARLNWLVRQLNRADANGIHVRLHWPGRTAHTQHALATLRENPDATTHDHPGSVAYSFEVVLAKDLAGKFSQRRNFISELERTVPEFYERVGQHLKSWVAPAPKLKEDKAEPSAVGPETLRQEAEQSALERHEPASGARPASLDDSGAGTVQQSGSASGEDRPIDS
jgi:hypothetical protein